MQFTLYTMLDEKSVVTKNLTTAVTLVGNVLQETSVVNPVFLIEAQSISPLNYMYVPDFGRYYFINDVASVRTNLWRVSCSVDVLMSFNDYIYKLEAIIDKQENKFQSNLFLNDGSFVSDSRLGIEIVPFPEDKGFEREGMYILTTLGPGGSA